jgi:hypothetical protein
MQPVRRITTTLAVLFVLGACIIRPVLEMCDQWDRTLQTGQDTESAVMIVALCVGVLYAFACTIFRFVYARLASNTLFDTFAEFASTDVVVGFLAAILIPISPPVLTLRE